MLRLNNQTDQLIVISDIQESVSADSTREVSPNEEYKWKGSQDLLIEITAGNIKVERNGTEYTDYAEQVQALLDRFADVKISQNKAFTPAFADKVLPDGTKLFKRVHGQSANVSSTQSSHVFTVPYTVCKITGVEIINAEVGDFVDFNILDTTTGTVTGVPSYKLNQFGYNVYLAEGLHREISNYDADLFAGLQIEVKYTSVSSKTVYFNYILHEVKSS